MEKLIVSTGSSIWYDPNRPDESLEFIKKCGFEGIDFNFQSLYRKTFDPEKLTSFYDQILEELY